MTRYQRVLDILDQAVGGSNVNIGAHGAFWRGLSRDQFVAKKVFGVDLVVVGRGQDSNLVKSLKGEAPFGNDLPNPPPGAKYPRMPEGSPPVSDADIAFIQSWIDEGCLEDAVAPPPGGVMSWRPTNAPQATKRYDDIWFLGEKLGWTVNLNGEVLHTDDGGDSWTTQLHDPACYFRCISFASASRGWVGSVGGDTGAPLLYETHDGGNRWSAVAELPADAPVAVCGMWVVNESLVYVAGSNEPEQPVRMMKTSNGGLTWTAWDMRPWADNVIDVYFLNADCGWVVGGRTDEPRDLNPTKPKLRPVVLYTEDGGRTWTDQVAAIRKQLHLGEWGWKIQFLDERAGFISLQNYDEGAMLKTTDGGASWTRWPINDAQKNANLEGVGFVDEMRGWVGGWGDRPKQKQTSSETLDGGHTWYDANEIGKAINRFRFFGKPVRYGYAAGKTVYKYGPAPSRPVTVAAPKQGSLIENLEPTTAVNTANVAITVPAGAARLTVRIWDPDGPLVRRLVDEVRPAPGPRVLTWDRTNDAGQLLPAEAYIWRVTVDQTSESTLVVFQAAP
jgi:photosystem II stability/assembly factor-like uncharacterized protein